MPIYETINEYVRAHGVEWAGRAFVAVLIVLGAVVVARIARRAVAATIAARSDDRRAATLAPAVQSLVRTLLLGAGIITALHQLGVNVTTVLAGAGVLGLAVGFGAQTLVRDVISGFFLIVDGVVEAGDHISFNAVSGIVEEVGLRMTQIRSYDGRLWYVPNGELKIVGNYNRAWARAVVNVPVAYEQDIGVALELIQEVGDAWATEHEELVLEPPEAQGVMNLGASDVGIRLVVKVVAMEHWAVERELTRRIKQALDARGLDLPVPRQVVYHRNKWTAEAAGANR